MAQIDDFDVDREEIFSIFKIRKAISISKSTMGFWHLLLNLAYAIGFGLSESNHLHLTAVTSTGPNNAARFQCWRFANIFKEYPTVGKSMQLADVSNATYVVLPPNSQEGDLFYAISPIGTNGDL
jgi:hypothetical protein